MGETAVRLAGETGFELPSRHDETIFTLVTVRGTKSHFWSLVVNNRGFHPGWFSLEVQAEQRELPLSMTVFT